MDVTEGVNGLPKSGDLWLLVGYIVDQCGCKSAVHERSRAAQTPSSTFGLHGPQRSILRVIFVSLNFHGADQTGVVMTSDTNPGKTISTPSNLYQN
ncbi:hypothetical protein PABG_12513 [Paracoccidioides brasiliensis Pb03]|nr:hypothetical protein PABG_12513 [Paracoccidioides brasiliensis Pb03]